MPSVGTSVVDQLAQPVGLLAQPRMPVVLVGMHRAAEDEHGVVARRAAARRSAAKLHSVEPVARLGDDGREQLRPRVLAVHDREDVHADYVRRSP